MKRFLISLFIIYCGALYAEQGTGEKKYTLRYQFRPGETLRWNVEHRTVVRTTVTGQTETVETDSRSVKAWRVRNVNPDGTVVFEHLVESVDMRQWLAGGREVRYNSKTDPKPPLGFEDAAAAVGVPLTIVTLDLQGKVIKRERKINATATPNQGEMTVPMPQDPIAVGQTWSMPCDIDVPMKSGGIKKIKALQQFTLENVKTGVASIRMATQILTPVNNPEIEVQVVERAKTGVIRFDIDAGRILSQQMDIDKHVVGFQGQSSSIHYQMRFFEDFLPQTLRTAAK